MTDICTIEPMRADDYAAVRVIYQDGLSSGIAAFMQTAPDWTRFAAGHLEVGRLVARDQGRIVGWAALGAVADS